MAWRKGRRPRSLRPTRRTRVGAANLTHRRLWFESLENRQLLSATALGNASNAQSIAVTVSQLQSPASHIPETVTVLPFAGPDQAVIVEPDGKVIVAHGDGSTTTINVYNADGTPDMQFGSGGEVTNIFGASQNSVAAIALQADGKIVVVGWVVDQNLKSSFSIVRYNSDGSLDTSFGSCGIVVTSVDRGDDLPTSVVIQPDGKIVIGGAAGASLPWNWNPLYPGITPDFLISPRYSPVLLRYNPDGSLDSSFNGTGIDEFYYDNYPSQGSASPFLPNPLPLNDASSINQLQIQADGKIIVAAGPDIVRINTDGSIDQTFGQGGLITVPMPLFGGAIQNLVIQPDGKFLVATNSYAAVNEFAISMARYNADGSLDMTFNNGIPVLTPETPDGWGELTDLAVRPDGKIVASATVNYLGAQSYGVLARYNSDGSLDASFGTDGQVFEQAYGWNVVAVQSDGKLIAVGGGIMDSDGVQATSDFHVKRFNADGTEDIGFDTSIMTQVDPSGPLAAPPSRALPNVASPTTPGATALKLDVNDDAIVAPLDALMVINYMIDSVNLPLVSIAVAAESVAAHAVTTVVDVVPSIQVLSVDQAISQMTGATADGQTNGSSIVASPAASLEPSDMTGATAASTVTATTTLLATDDV